MTETDRDKFVRLTESRVNRVMETLRLVGNLSSRQNYQWEHEDVKKIKAALEDGVAECIKCFHRAKHKDVKLFKLNKIETDND